MDDPELTPVLSCQRPFEVGDRGVAVPPSRVDDPPVQEGVGESRGELQGPVIVVQGEVELAEGLVGQGPVVMALGRVRASAMQTRKASTAPPKCPSR